jgi:hypothetical protein
MSEGSLDVFINCPFDSEYQPFFNAILFTVTDCGFRARTAREIEDSGDTRIAKLYRLIEECRFGIHDISRIELDSKSGLPRFNMPLELGIFLGARAFGHGSLSDKKCLIMDRTAYRYKKFCSDISGQDIRPYHGRQIALVTGIRDWLRQWAPPGRSLPGGDAMNRRYNDFKKELPGICAIERLNVKKIHYLDYLTLTTAWLRENP